MADNVEVKLGAQVDPLKAGMDEGAASVQSSLDKINEALAKLVDNSRDAAAKVKKNNDDMVASFKAQAQAITSGFNLIKNSLVVTAIVAGFHEVMDAMLATEDSVRGLEIVFGLSAEAAERFAIQLKVAGVDTSTFEGMALRASRTLRTQQGEWERLGVVIKDASTGQLLPLDQILRNLYTRMQDFKAGVDQDMVVMSLAGRGAKDFASDMQRLEAAQKDAAVQAEKFAGSMNAERQNQVEQYRRNVNTFKLSLEELGTEIGINTIPLLQKLADWFAKGMAANKGMLTSLENTARASGTADSWGGEAKRLTVSQMGTAGAPVPKSGTLGYTPPPKAGTADDNAAIWDNILKQAENAYNNQKIQQGSFQRWSLEMTRDYWQSVIDYGNVGGKDLMEVQNKFYAADEQVQKQAFQTELAGVLGQTAAYKYNYDAQIAIVQHAHDMIVEKNQGETDKSQALLARIVDLRQRAADQQEAIEKTKTDMIESYQAAEFTLAKTNLDQQVALRQISLQTALTQEAVFLDQKYAMDIDAANKLIADSADNPEKLATAYKQKLALELKYQEDKTALVNQAELDRKQFAITAAQDVENAFGNLLGNLADGTKKWTDTFKDAIKSLTQQLNQLAGQALAKQFLGAGTAGGDFISKITGGIFGGGKDAGGAAALTTAGTTLTTAGVTLEAAAVALQAAATATSLGSTSSGLNGLITQLFPVPQLAEGTPYVKSDGLAYIHKGEAVIPAAMNSAGTGGARINQNVTFAIQGGWDGKTQHQAAKTMARATQMAMRQA